MAIQDYRQEQIGKTDTTLRRKAYILNSFKHPDEVKTLRKIYGQAFCVISLYAPRAERVDSLSELIAQSHHGFDKEKYRDVAEALIERDASAANGDFGQDVRDTFPLADFFLRSSEKSTMKAELKGDGPTSTCASGGLLDYPHYTRPADFRGMAVPEILVSGNHDGIRLWRRRAALEKTMRNRPDLLNWAALSAEDKQLLAQITSKKITTKESDHDEPDY